MLQNHKVCVRSIVEVNALAEAISAKVRFPERIWHSTKSFAFLEKKTVEILTNFYSYSLQEFFVIYICNKY